LARWVQLRTRALTAWARCRRPLQDENLELMAQLSELEVMQRQHRSLQQQVLQEVRQLQEVTSGTAVLQQERSQLQQAARELAELQFSNQRLARRLSGLQEARGEHARLQLQLEGLQLGLQQATHSAPLPALPAGLMRAVEAEQAVAAEDWLEALKLGAEEEEEEERGAAALQLQRAAGSGGPLQPGLLQRLQDLAAVLPGMDAHEQAVALQDLQETCQQLQEQVQESAR
jgi:myosin heavy subunit